MVYIIIFLFQFCIVVMSLLWNCRVTVVAPQDGAGGVFPQEARYRHTNTMDEVELVFLRTGEKSYHAAGMYTRMTRRYRVPTR